MSADGVRKLLGSLLEDPENEAVWNQLESGALGGEIARDARADLAGVRQRLAARGEAEAVARLLDLEALLYDDGDPQRAELVRERARVLEEDLFDDKGAMAALDTLKEQDPEAVEYRERIQRKKEKWRDLVDAFRKHALETPEPAAIARHLASAGVVVLQYKSKGRDKDVDTLFKEALSVDAGNVRAIQLYERILRKRGKNWDELASHLERGAAAVSDPTAKVALLFRAARVHGGKRKSLADAETVYREILRIEPSNPDASRFLIVIFTEQNRTDDVVRMYEDQLRLPGSENDLGLLIQVAMGHWRMRNDPAAAAPYFARVHAAHPEHPLPGNFFRENPKFAPGGGAAADDVDLEVGGEEELDSDLGEEEAVAQAAEPPVVAQSAPAAPVVAPPPAAPAAPAPQPMRSEPPKPSNARIVMAIDLAHQAEQTGNVDRSVEAWKGVLRVDPTNHDAREALVRLYGNAGRWNNVVEMFRQELDALGGTKEAGAQMHRERKLEILREMVAIYRDRMGLEPMVVQTYNAILAIAPEDTVALAALGASYEKLGRHTDLIKVLEQQAEHEKTPRERIAILRRIAKIWIERFNNVNNATKPLEQILTIDPTDTDAIHELKDLYTKRRAWRPLYDVLRREVETLGGDGRRDAYVELAKLAAEKLNSAAEAIANWREAVAIDPRTPGALDALEKLTERERDYAGLAQVLEQRAQDALDSETRANILMKLGAVYGERLNDTAKCIDAWKRVLEVKPGFPKAQRVLRESFSAAGDWDALEAMYAETDDYEGLVEVLGSAADREENPATKIALSFRSAAIYTGRLKQPARAFRSYERVLAADPKNVRAAEALLPIYLNDEKWPRLAQLYEVLLGALDRTDVSGALDLLEKLRELSASKLGDRAGAFRWALRAYQLAPDDIALEERMEKAAAQAGAWRELVDTFDARAAAVDDANERARLRDKAGAIEADKLAAIDAAIARYQAALRATPDDATVLSLLDGLLRRSERWRDLRDLHEQRLAKLSRGGERRMLLRELAEIEEVRLHDADAARARHRAILDQEPNDAEALEALSRLAESGGRWDELAKLVAQRRDEASGAVRAELAFKLGELRAGQLGEHEGAIECYREVLALAPHHPAALASLEALLRNDRFRVVAATILEPEFAAIGEARKLAWALQILLDASRDADERKSLTLRLAKVYGEQLTDPRSGFDLVRGILLEQPHQRELADELETLAAQGGWNEELATAFSQIVARADLPPDVRIDTARRVAAVYDDRLQRRDAAEPFHKIVLESGELDPHAFGQLKTFYQEREAWDSLRGLYGTWVERSSDATTKIEMLSEEALVVEEILDQPDASIEVYQKIHALDSSNGVAFRALDRLYTRQRRWADLAALLTQWLDCAPSERVDLRFRRGEVLERELGEFSRALDDFEAVVMEAPAHPGAQAALERLIASRPELRLRAGAVLEPLYEAQGDAGAKDLVRMLLVRLEGTTTAVDRAELHRRVAELREIVLNDEGGAFDSMHEAFLAEPASSQFRADLLRLAEVAGQNARAADALERASRADEAQTARVDILKDLALVVDERLGDLARAETIYARLLATAPDDAEVVRPSAAALERIYAGSGNARGLVDALRQRARFENDAEVRRELHARAGEMQEAELRDLPGAIESQRARLEIDPNDREALKSLARLYAATERWPDLVETLRADAALADAEGERKALLLRAATTLEERIADVDGAIALYADILASFGADRSVLGALARLYELADRWTDLLEVLEQDLAIAESQADRLSITVRIAELRRTKTNDLARGVEGYQEALQMDPTNASARSALQALLNQADVSVALAAARALAPVLETDGAWAALVDVMDKIASATDDPDEKRRSLARAADVCEIGLNDNARAFEYCARELRESLGEADLRRRVDHLERLAAAAGAHEKLAAALREIAPELVDPDLQIDTFMKVAQLSRGPLGDAATARDFYEKALEQRPDHTPALDALESLHESAEAWSQLIDVLRRKIELSVVDGERRELLRKQARAFEDRVGDRAGAARAYEAIMELGADAQAATALERIYSAEARWDDLSQLLENQLALASADSVELNHRLGVVAAARQDNPDRALDHFREVLEHKRDHAPTVAALEELGKREGYESRVAEILEPIYLSRLDWPNVIRSVETRIAHESDSTARRELLSRLGTIYGENLGDLEKALDTYARVFREDMHDRGNWETISKLAKLLGRFDRQAAIYADVIDERGVEDDASAELAFEAGRLFDQHVKDSKRAISLYRKVLAFDPSRDDVLRALESLLVREGAHADLLALYGEAIQNAVEPGRQKEFLFKVADIHERATGDLGAAIETLRRVLEIDPSERQAITRLDELLSRTERWSELAALLDTLVADAMDSGDRAALRLRLGRLRADKLDDALGAIDAFEAIVQERRTDRDAVAALERIADAKPDLRMRVVDILEPLYRENDDWAKLVVVLNVRLAASSDPMERGALLREVGQIKEKRAKDVAGAFAAFAMAFGIDPGDGEARTEVERLASAHGLWDDLVQTYENGFKASEDSVVKADLLRAIADTHDQRRDDPRAAIEAYERLYALDDSQVEALDLLQGLHVLLSDWEGLVRVLERKVERAMDDEQRKALLHEIGEYQRDMLGNAAAATIAFKRALDLDPANSVALEALDDLYSAANDSRALTEILRQRLEAEGDPESRRVLALRLGRLWERELQDSTQAIEAYRRVLDDAPSEPEALSALDRLYQSTGAHQDLLDNLRAQANVATDESSRTALRLRIGKLLSSELSDATGALESYRDVLAGDPGNAVAIEAVRQLARRESERGEAVAILEPIFRQGARWDDLVQVLEWKVASLDDPMARRDELRAIAQVHETGRGDLAAAFEASRRALHEDPSHASTLGDLERLAAATGRWAEIVSHLEEESRASSDPQAARDLAVRAAQLTEAQLQDDARAIASYRHALAQGDDEAVLEALDRAYERTSQWTELVEVLERRGAMTGDPAVLDPLDVRVGQLKEQRFRDFAGALASYRNVVERSPNNGDAIDGLHRLLEVPATRAEALDLLEQTYTTLDNPTKLAWLLGMRVQAADLPSDKVRLLQDLSRLREDRLRDHAGALHALVDAVSIDPREEQVLLDIERLAPVAGAWNTLRGVIERTLTEHGGDLDSVTTAQLNLRAARWYRDQLQDPAAAEERLRAALAVEPESTDAVELLESIHRMPGRERDLVGTLRRRADMELDVTAKKQMLREATGIAERALVDVDLAAACTASLLEADDSDLEGLDTLARLRTAQGKHTEVAELLAKRARLTDDTALAVQLRRQVAELLAGPIGDAEGAITAYRELLDFDPTDQNARTAVEDMLEKMGRFKDLTEALRGRIETAVSADERNVTRLRLARLAESQFKSPSDAIEYLREILDETPGNREAGTELERLYAAGKRWQDLTDLLERRAQDCVDAGDLPGELTALVRIGELNEKELGSAARAVELYGRVLERDPNHVGALFALARLHEGDQLWDRAAEMLSRAADLATAGKDGAEVALRLASLRAEKLSDEPGAETALRRALELDPASQQAIDRLKTMATRRKDDSLLAEMMEREVELHTDAKKRVAILKSLAEIARDRLKDAGRAAGYLERARAIAPEDRDLQLPLVDLYIAAGRQRDAVPVIESIIASYGGKRSKDLATWHHRLGKCLEALGDTAGALTQLDAAFKIDLTNIGILRDLGMLCYRMGDHERAQKTFRALLLQRLDANSGITKADVYYYLGDSLRTQKDLPKAINMLERALEADKQHAAAAALLAELKK